MEQGIYTAITNIENFVDGLLYIDANLRVVYHKQFNRFEKNVLFKEAETVGKKITEIFIDYDEETSPLCRAIKYGEYTLSSLQTLRFYTGEVILALCTVMPVKKNNVIIGAISISQATGPDYTGQYIDLAPNLSTLAAPDSVKRFFTIDDIIGNSKVISRLKSDILKIAASRSNVLIVGETGTGKELVAQSIHSHSPRKEKPFIAQNCAAIPHTLLESIFFGTTKGSFTGAVDAPGMFERANGGTIFLDEINSMDLSLQSKILRVLEEGSVTRVGGKNPIPMDVRIISTTNQEPKVCLVKNILRRDLFYRISTLQIRLPTLQERIEDLIPLAEYFMEHYSKETGKHIKGLDSEVYDAFRTYDWPGNIREFKNVLESAFSFADSPYITMEDIPLYLMETISDPDSLLMKEKAEKNPLNIRLNQSLRDAVEEFEKKYILYHGEGTTSLVDLADKLSISKQLLNHKIKKYDLKL